MTKILLAGSTGYLGSHILKALIERNIEVRTVVRNTNKLEAILSKGNSIEVIQAQLTTPQSLINCCDNIDTVISTVGITKQKDGLTYMDVDYQANLNLLNEAKNSGVRKFIYVSVLNGVQLQHLDICKAKEKFVQELINSGLDYCIIRPNGFFSDMSEFYEMAKKGRIYLFGNGEIKANPISGLDLAIECINAIENEDKEINIGGPQTLTQNEIAKIAFGAAQTKIKITYIPDWVRRLVLYISNIVLSKKKFGPIQFIMTVMAMGMIAPEYGNHKLKDFFIALNNENAG